MKKLIYEHLALVPSIVAEQVCLMPYSGPEQGNIENFRLNMPEESKKEFVQLCDQRCREAYNAESVWFMKCVKAKGNTGRDQLYIWLSHWLAAFLKEPIAFRRSITLRDRVCAVDVKPGQVFKDLGSDGDGLADQVQFIRLRGNTHDEVPVVNVATWTAAKVDADQEVVIIGKFQRNPMFN